MSTPLIQPVKGMNDVLPSEIARWQWLESVAREILSAHAYDEMRVPIVEQTDLFKRAIGEFTDVVAQAIRETTGEEPDLSTTGGTSDARFIRDLCPVLEFGLVGQTMHAVDEQVPVSQLRALQATYAEIIARYFARFGEASAGSA